ncbi:MAG TPA: hypothetical protein VG345_15015 [Bryobacteraceae bacterium]|nr:hypothetical protein [Bryobacteraceae bacterium]
MAGYIFVPVPTTEMLKFAKQWTDGQTDKGKTAYRLLYSVDVGLTKAYRRHFGAGLLTGGAGVLRAVAATDKLYVLTHGNSKGSSRIGEDRADGTEKYYTPDGFARTLEQEGLIKSFVDLRLYVCGSATVPKGQSASFAERLKASMRARGYVHLSVTGYHGSVYTEYSSDGKSDEKHKITQIGANLMRASTQKVTF